MNAKWLSHLTTFKDFFWQKKEISEDQLKDTVKVLKHKISLQRDTVKFLGRCCYVLQIAVLALLLILLAKN